jgi:UDP-N-acetylglucosamine 2-epimerase (non-hydrolysing)
MQKKYNLMVAFGTRPEAIKLAPVIQKIKQSENLEAITVATGQHRHLLDQVTAFFEIQPDFDLNLMKPNQDLFYTTQECMGRIRPLMEKLAPDMLIVQGDTTTAFAAALAAFYLKIPVAHVEAGLRTYEKFSPFPEEMNRRLITPLADLHFAPTAMAKMNLLKEGVAENRILMTGNTSVDALLMGCKRHLSPPKELNNTKSSQFILLTLHRRENFGEPALKILSSVRTFALKHPEFQIVYPVHPNPNIKLVADHLLGEVPNVSLIAPVNYQEMLFLMKNAQFILTDSGGIQEEAPTLGKPVLVLRESTERPEAVESGCAQLVGHQSELILKLMESLTNKNSELYLNMSQAGQPYGNGSAAKLIVQAIDHFLKTTERGTTPCVESSATLEPKTQLNYF